MTASQHPVDVLLDAMRKGPADIVALTQRTGFYAGAVLSLVTRARASGFDISARHIDGVTIYELHEETLDGLIRDPDDIGNRDDTDA